MIMNKKVAVVIPAYNEEDFIRQTVMEVPNQVDVIVCVDDRSKDNTYNIMLGLTKQDLRVRVIQTDKNGGIGHAVRTGFSYIMDKVDYVSVLPGDNQCDARLIVDFVMKCEKEQLDCVKGNRFAHNNDTSSMPKTRKLGNMMYSFVTKIVSGYFSIFDSQHGFCAINTNILKKTTVEHIRRDYLFDNSLWIMLNAYGARVGEIRSPVRYQGEVSDIKYLKFIGASVRYFVYAYFWRIRKKYGMINFMYISIVVAAIFLVLGLVFANIWYVAYGVVTLLWALFYDYWRDPNRKPKNGSL